MWNPFSQNQKKTETNIAAIDQRKEIPKYLGLAMNNPNLCTMNPTHRRVQHNYHDHASDSSGDYNNTLSAFASKTEQPFPAKLHFMLDDMEKDGQAHIISWAPHGRCK